jgi:phosphate transport system protein
MFSFKQIYDLWKSADSLTQALEDSHVMLESTQEMFTESVKSLRRSDTAEVDIDIYKMDQAINRYERQVRRKVLKHLAIVGGVNMIPGLILTSIVIDIERIGDYAKNIKELAVSHPDRLQCGRYDEDIKRIEDGVSEIYQEVIPALKASDADRARKVLTDHWWIITTCDEIVESLITAPDPDLSPTDAIITALYTRYLKRISAHLSNIATSVFNPFERIGFREEIDT